MDDEQFASLPEALTVRELRYAVHCNGFRAKQITLVTTLLYDSVYSKLGLTDLYRRRWEIETNIRHLKTTMKMEVLKCKTVDGVLRELHVFALVCNLVRQIMIERQRLRRYSQSKLASSTPCVGLSQRVRANC